MFVSAADELYGPITTIRRDGRITKNIPWTAFQTEKHDWGRVADVKNILAVRANRSPFISCLDTVP